MGRLFRILLGIGIGFAVFFLVRRFFFPAGNESAVGESFAPAPGPLMGGDDGLTINEADLGGEVAPDLLEILVDPVDKQPLELVDRKWLINRRTGRRYPIVTGIPIMLPEVGEKYRDASLVTVQSDNGHA